MEFGLTVALSLLNFVIVAAMCAFVAQGARKIGQLQDWPLDQTMLDRSRAQPRVSIIVTALNEADTIEPALRSLLAIDYPALEIIVINDRSTDATGTILQRIAATERRLKIVQIDTLPAGWLGKNHALHVGANIASGDYLLFTDADVVFAPSAVSRAVKYAESNQSDHLTLLFDVVARTQMLRLLILSFAIAFMARFQPWRVRHSKSHFIGIGGFNLVRTSAYRRAGGHAAIPLAILDDLMLGKLLKQTGSTQDVLMGTNLVGVEWYRDTFDMARGLEKNIFAAFDFKLSYLFAATCAIVATRVWPWIGIVVLDGAARWLSLGAACAITLLHADFLRIRGWSYASLLLAPIAPLVELAIWWRGSLLTIFRQGIVWRGTLYPLAEIRKHHAARNPTNTGN